MLVSKRLSNPIAVATNADPIERSTLYLPVTAMNLPVEIVVTVNPNCEASIRKPELVAESPRTT